MRRGWGRERCQGCLGMHEGELACQAPASPWGSVGQPAGLGHGSRGQSRAGCPGVQLLLVASERFSGSVPVGVVPRDKEAVNALPSKL